jgi:hypothetical protein
MSTKPEERLALAQRLAALQGKRKLDAILDAPDPRALVRSLPAEDLYFTVKELGLDDAHELVQLASPAQFRTFVDLDCWRRETLKPRALLPWLRAADDDEDGLEQKIKALDVETVVVLLRDTVAVWDLEEDPDREPLGSPWRSPEGRYVVDFQLEGEDQQTLRRIVETYYQQDPLQAVRFLEAVRWELPSELEEQALRWRNARLADLGFPELERALSLYAYTDPDAPLPTVHSAPHEPPGFFLETLGSQGFVDQVLAKLSADDLSRIDRELLAVLNGALVANAIDPDQLDEVRKALAAARDHLSLGLEYRAGGDATKARELLLTAPIARIFQIASGLVLKRKFRADRLIAAGWASFPGAKAHSWFDLPLGPAVDGLRRKRPLFYAPLEREGAPSELRPFRNRQDLSRIDDALARAEALGELLSRSGLEPARAEALARQARAELFSDVRLSELMLHVLLQERGEPVSQMRLLQAGELPDRLSWALSAKGQVSAALREAASKRLSGLARTDLERQVANDLEAYLLKLAADELSPLLGSSPPYEPALAASLPLLIAP